MKFKIIKSRRKETLQKLSSIIDEVKASKGVGLPSMEFIYLQLEAMGRQDIIDKLKGE